jgi:hypothetical protein
MASAFPLKYLSTALSSLLLVSACASTPGVAPVGPGLYLVTRQAATGFTGIAGLKAAALSEADDFCKDRKLTSSVVSMTETKPPFKLGNFPRSDIQFRCVPP